MPGGRSDERDDYDDLPPDPRPRPRSNPAVAIILILAGVVVVLLAVCGGVVALFWMRAAPVAPAGPIVNAGPTAGPTRRIFDRADFRALVLAADRDSVTRDVGAPPNGVELGPPEVWHYGGVTRDPATGLIDTDAIVVFENGRVKDVRFTPAGARK